MKVRITCGLTDRSMTYRAIANTGYETERPKIMVSTSAARALGVWPNIPDEAEVREYRTAGGIARVVRVPDSANVSVLAGDREVMFEGASLVISELESDVLLSDMLLDKLRIEILRAGRGIWRFSDDPPEKKRESM